MLDIWNEKGKDTAGQAGTRNVRQGNQQQARPGPYHQPYPPAPQDKSPKSVKNLMHLGENCQKAQSSNTAYRRLFED